MKSAYERALYLESLEIQRRNYLLLANSHHAWAQDADDETIAHLHIETAFLIKEAADRIGLLLETLNGSVDKA